jgi:drug/metabolite transporter (DMT)-like permease
MGLSDEVDEESSRRPATELDPLLNIPEDNVPQRPINPNALQAQGKAKSLFTMPTGPRKKNRHHRPARSSIGEIMQSFSDGLDTISEGIQLEAAMVRGTFQQQLEDSEYGKRFFLDMTMTRSLSVLPENLGDFMEEATGVEITDETPAVAGPAGPYLALLGAVLAVSSNGTALAMLHNVEPPMKLFWRMTVTSLVLSGFAVKTVHKEGFPVLTSSQWMTFGSAVVSFVGGALLLVTAFEYTSIGNAVIGANSQAILLILGKLLVGEPVVLMEGGGVLVAFFGCILCAGGEAKDNSDDSDKEGLALFGDLIALASGICGVGYLTFAKAVRPHLSVTVFMFLMMASGSLLLLMFMIVTGVPFTFNNDPYHGLFGWMNFEENRIFILLHIALVCNVVGTMGFVRAMQHFDNIIIAVATLLEPICATLIAVLLGVGSLPGPLGWIGNALVAIGTLGVVYPSVNKPMEH